MIYVTMRAIYKRQNHDFEMMNSTHTVHYKKYFNLSFYVALAIMFIVRFYTHVEHIHMNAYGFFNNFSKLKKKYDF